MTRCATGHAGGHGASTGSGTITIESDGSLKVNNPTANVFRVGNDNAQAQSVSIDTTVNARGNAELGVQASSQSATRSRCTSARHRAIRPS